MFDELFFIIKKYVYMFRKKQLPEKIVVNTMRNKNGFFLILPCGI